MFDFDHLAPVKTHKIKLPSLFRWPRTSPHPIEIEFRHAGDGTPEFKSERLKRAKAQKDAPTTDEARYEQVVKLWADTLIVGWEGPLDTAGKPLAYTKALGFELFQAMIRAKRFDVIDWISSQITDADNFHEPVALPEELGKD